MGLKHETHIFSTYLPLTGRGKKNYFVQFHCLYACLYLCFAMESYTQPNSENIPLKTIQKYIYINNLKLVHYTARLVFIVPAVNLILDAVILTIMSTDLTLRNLNPD